MIDFDKDTFRRDPNELRQALEAAGARFKGPTAFVCPFHEDRSPSGSVYQEGGFWHFKCHGCGCGGDVFDAVARHKGIAVEDVLREYSGQYGSRPRPAPRAPAAPPPKPPKVHPDLAALKAAALWVTKDRGAVEVERIYPYTNPARWTPEVRGEEAVARVADLLVLRVRTEKNGKADKTFVQATPVDGGFILKKPEGRQPLYNRIRVQRAHSVLVVEGEKAVEAVTPCLRNTMAATTSPGGAKNGEHADWSPLADKSVYLWPDFDPIDPKTGKRSGEEHMRTVAAELAKLTPQPSVHWVSPEDIGLDDDGSDVVEFLEAFGNGTDEGRRDALATALEIAKPLDGAAELRDLIEEEIAGKHRTIAFPWAATTRLSKALRPGTVTLMCGDPGSGKSLWILEALAWWHQNGVKVAAYELEEDRAYHLKRILAQLCEKSELTDAEWVEKNPTEARAHFNLRRHTIAGLTPCIDAAPDDPPTYRQLLDWLEARAAAGARVIVIDPITAAATADKPWVEDLQFLMGAKAIVRRHGCSLILVTHPRKGGKRQPGASVLDDMAGGAAFPRFCQTVLWLMRHETPKAVRCSGFGESGTFETTINRSLRLGKTRNGPGAGLEVGFSFEPDSLRFGEQGVVVEDVSKKPTPKPKGVQFPPIPAAPQDLDLEGF